MMVCRELWASTAGLSVACILLALASACGSGAGASGTAIDAGVGDAGLPPAPDAGPAGPGIDAGVDAPPRDTNPFPDDPAGGEFAWAVSATGADWSWVAVDGAGNILVAARQGGPVAIGNIRVPAPTSFQALLVLKLTPSGTPVWARSFESHTRIDPRAIAVTPAGDVVVGAVFEGPPQPPSLAVDDALVAVLDGGTGATRWSVELASAGDDKVSGLAAGPDGAGGAAIYVLGRLGLDTTVAGQPVAAGAHLIRFDADGVVRWARSVPGDAGFFEALVLDPARGPVIASNGGGDPSIDDPTIPGSGTLVAGFDPDGNVRFVRKLASSDPALFHSLAIDPGGDIYVASTTSNTETAVEDHVIPVPGFVDYPYLLRLTADGRYAAAHVISGDQLGVSASVTTDAEGAAYLRFDCGHANVQPEIDCGSLRGSVIASYGSDGEYRWATSVKSEHVDAVAAAPGNRLIVVGSGDPGAIELGGVTVPSGGLVIAALAGGAARPPSPLPPVPTITGAALDGVSDAQIRQGATGKLRILGTGLDRITSARLGDIEIHVPPAAGAATSLVLDVMIPHGHAPGPLGLQLGNAGGFARFDGVVTVTPIVVTPTGSTTGRGTFSSPLSFCRNDWFSLTRYGDLVLLRNGTYACDGSITVHGGVTIRGESKAGTVITGLTGKNDTFGGLGTISVDNIGTTAIENLTITSSRTEAAFSGGAAISVSDVDVQGVSGGGVSVGGFGTATVTRFNYLQSSGAAIVVGSGKVIATAVRAEGAFRGVLMTSGTLTMSDSLLSSTEPAVEAGDDNLHLGVVITLTNTVLRSRRSGLSAAAAVVTMTGCTIEPLPDPHIDQGVFLAGGSLAMSDSQIHGWVDGIAVRPVIVLGGAGPSTIDELTLTSIVNLDLDHVDIAALETGILYDAGGIGLTGGRFSLHHSHIRADGGADLGAAAVVLSELFTADLGTAVAPGDNQLEAVGGVALFDARGLAGAAIDAHGTTLNGNAHEGDVLGPVQTTDYQVQGPNTIHF
jgi:hypothetical protein